MKVNTGKGTISLITLIAIWSVSLVVNLPGLAISPLLGELDKVFPNATHLEIQLLTILPNLFIIPFVLLSGKLSMSRKKTPILVFALLIYLLSGILYFVAQTIWQLILISCLLGIGCGLVIPLAAGLLSDYFVGKYRMQQLGIKSGVANISLVVSTFIVGWLGGGNWHLPFIVYLMPIIPLLLIPFLRKQPAPTLVEHPKEKGVVAKKNLIGIMAFYFFVTYIVVILSYYLPFIAQTLGISDTWLGIITSLFFLAIFLAGTFLSPIIRLWKEYTIGAALVSLAMGLFVLLIWQNVVSLTIGALLMGYGYGVVQPIIYDKSTYTVSNDNNATWALSLVLATNYLAVTIAPFIIDLFEKVLNMHGKMFPFVLNFILMLLFIVIFYYCRKGFVFSVDKSYYQK